MKRTHLLTYEYGKSRRVYADENGDLFYRVNGSLHGTYRNYCHADVKDRDEMLDLITNTAAMLTRNFSMESYRECFRLADEYNSCTWDEDEIMLADITDVNGDLSGILIEDEAIYFTTER